nr:hypothetical protein [Butyrivibrio sp.]
YDREGYLRSEGENDKDYISIIYDTLQIDGEVKPLPVKVVTDDGSYIELFYDSEGYLTKVIDNTDRTLSYGYEIRVIEGKKEYFLIDATYPNGAVRRYSYNEQGLIDSVLSPNGIVALRNEYDEKRRVTHQIFPDGGEMSYSYDDENNITTATEQNGLKVEYLSDERGRNIGTRYVGVEPGDTVQDENNKDKVVEEYYTYNERNQKTSVTDRRGYTTRYFYDRRGHLTKVIGPDGLNESYTYNADGKLVNKKDSEGNSYKYTYDLEGNLYSITDPEGNRTRYYYEDGKVTKIKSADRLEVSLSYDENGHISSITDKAGVTTKYECDSLGRVTATIDALGNRTEYTLDESDNITHVTDPLGNVTRYAYNSANLLEEIINPDGTTKTWAYNEIGKPFLYTDEEDHTTRITYNSSWKEDSITLPNGGEIHYTYDLLGNMICVTDPMGRKTAYSHDKAGNVLTVGSLTTTEDGQKDVTIQTSYTYDKLGRIKTETDGEGNTTTYTYDRNGNVITVTHANGSKTENSYDSMGRLVGTTDPEGNITTYTYDVCGNLKTTTDPIGVATENHYEVGKLVKVTKKAATDENEKEIIINAFEYDECGRLKKQTETDGLSIEYSYDKAGRTSTVTGSNGRVIKYSYDSMGRVAQTDDCGSITRFTYTGTGKIKSVIDALGNRTEYTYNELDLLSRIERFGDEDVETDTLEENFINRDESAFPSIDRKGHVTTFEHDLSGKLISEIDALGQKTIYTYDDRGELASQTDRDGNETIFTRDNAGNIVGISYADGHSVRLKYDALNILQEVEDYLGLTKIDTDNLGRCVSVTNPDGEKVSYEYGPKGEKTAVIYPDGKRAEYVYDSLGRLKVLRDIKDGKTDTINYTYDVNGHLKERIFPNGTGTTYDYYPGGLLKSLTSTDSKGILDKYEYTYNEKGNRTQITRQRRDLESISGTYAYSYDDLGRLTESTRNGNLQSAYTYDAFGNRTKEISEGIETTYSYDVLDRLIKKEVFGNSHNSEVISGIDPVITTYGYDRRGNLISEYEQEVLTKSYSYNMQNLLEKSVIRNTEADIQTVTYDYNYFGQRISKKNGLDEVRYLTDITRDHYNLLAQSINGYTTSFTYDDNVVSFEREGVRNFYQLDELGSTMYLTGTDGAAYNPYVYDPFGNRIDPTTGKKHRTPGFKQNQGYTREGNIIQPFAFTGYREEENGLYYAQARSYDPLSGRFTGEDRVRGLLSIPESVNHYLYCLSNPIIMADFNGLWPTVLVGAIGGAIVGAVSYTVGAVVSGEKIDATQMLASAAGGAAAGALIGSGVVDPTIVGAAAGAASGFVTGAANTVKEVANTVKSGGTALEIANSVVNGIGNTAKATAQGGIIGGVMGTAFGKLGGGAAIVAGGVIKGGLALGQELTDTDPGVDVVKVLRHTAGGALETAVAVCGFKALGKGLATKETSSLGKKIYEQCSKITEYNNTVRANYNELKGRVSDYVNKGISNFRNNMNRLFNPYTFIPEPVLADGYTLGCSGENGSTSSVMNADAAAGSSTTGLDALNSNGTNQDKRLCDMTDAELQELGYKRYSDGSIRDSKGHFVGNSGTVPGTPGVDTAEQYLTDNGYTVKGREITVRNADGTARRYDIVVEDGNGNIVGIEVKSGSAVRTNQQVKIDAELNSCGGLDTVGGNAQDAGVSHIDSAIEVRVDTNGNVTMPNGK